MISRKEEEAMKRAFSLILALVLALSVSLSLAEGNTFQTKYFALTLPDGWITDYTVKAEEEEDVEFLGCFAAPDSPGLIVESAMIYEEELKDIALWNSDSVDIQSYIEVLLESFEEDNPVYLDTVMAGKIPFVMIRCEDEEGQYIYIDTMTNGYTIQFLAAVMDDDRYYSIPDADIEQLKAIFATFQPVASN